MLLAGSNKPTDEQLSTFISALKKEGDVVSLKKFIQTSAWFDRTEGANTASQMIEAATSGNTSEDEDDADAAKRVKSNPRL